MKKITLSLALLLISIAAEALVPIKRAISVRPRNNLIVNCPANSTLAIQCSSPNNCTYNGAPNVGAWAFQTLVASGMPAGYQKNEANFVLTNGRVEIQGSAKAAYCTYEFYFGAVKYDVKMMITPPPFTNCVFSLASRNITCQ